MSSNTPHKPQLLVEYEEIAKNNVAQKISFYRVNEQLFSKIPYHIRHEVEKDFLLSLFQSGYYSEYLVRCVGFIEKLFDAQTFPVFDREALEEILFHKAACEFNLQNIEESEETMKQLIPIQNRLTSISEELLIQINTKKREYRNIQVRGIVIALVLTSALLNVWNIMLVESFSPERLEMYQFAAWAIWGFAIILWGGETWYNKYFVRKETKRLVKEGNAQRANNVNNETEIFGKA